VVAVLVRMPMTGEASRSESADAPVSGRPTAGWTSLVPAILRPLATDAAVSFAAGLLMVLPVLMVAGVAGRDATYAGAMSVVAGIGGVAGAGVAAAFVNSMPARGMFGALGAAMVGLILVATTPVAAALLVGVGALAAAVVALDTLNMTQVQRVLDAAVLGRGFGLIHTSAAVWVILGSLLPTLLVGRLGVPIVVLGSALVIAVLGGLGLVPSAGLGSSRRVQREVGAQV
jgi:hypothetical protein